MGSFHKTPVVVTMPDGTEYFDDITSFADVLGRNDLEQHCLNVVRRLGITTPRSAPETIPVKLERLSLQKGQVVRSRPSIFHISPPLAPPTAQEYAEELAAILEPLPPAFRTFVGQKAYDDGHHAGYEEVLLLARNLAYALEQTLKEYHADLEERQEG